MTPRRVVVVGASLAGATTAITLRQQGFDGQITLLGEEPHPPYERPGLSKGYLSGELDRAALLLQPERAYRDADISLLVRTRAIGLDAGRRVVEVEGGHALPYDALVITTGAVNVTPPLPGMTLPGVHQLRTVDDADRLASAAARARRAVVVGMGLIGCEVAATLRKRGLEVTMVDRLSGPLLAQVGPVLSARVRQWHEAHGVQLVADVEVSALLGHDHVESVLLADGRSLPADLGVVGVGARPATCWLSGAPLHLVHGAIGIDDAGRTSVPDVYAAGDVAAVWDPAAGTHRRSEHYRSAIDEGTRVAHALLGLPLPPAKPSWFWSDQYDHVLQVAGDIEGAELHELEDPYTALFTRGSTITGVAAVDNGRGFRSALRRMGTELAVPSAISG